MLNRRQQKVQAATALFWEQGYQATTMRDLQLTLDMRPGSIYATFGSKAGLFREVVEAYLQTSLHTFHQCQADTSNPLLGLRQFFEHCLFMDTATPASAHRQICLLTKVISEVSTAQPALVECAKKALKEMEQAFAQALEVAKERRLLSEEADSQPLAAWLQSQLIGLRVYASTQQPERLLRTMIDHVFAALPQPK